MKSDLPGSRGGRPRADEYSGGFANYIPKVTEDDILAAMQTQLQDFLSLLRPVSDQTGNTKHPPYEWSVKQVVQHVADAERVFAYRALRFARGDDTTLPSFDENAYALSAEADRVGFQALVDECEAVRRATILTFEHFPVEGWSRRGVASGHSLTVRALAYAIVGHARHHLEILRKRLGVDQPAPG